MYARLVWGAAALALVLSRPVAALAQIKPETLRVGKEATALVVLPTARGFATCFCVDPSGYFVTNRHVVDAGEGHGLKLVLRAGEEDQKTLDATVVRTDEARDLALLKAATAETLPALSLADKAALVETQPVIVFGYPFGTALRVKEQEYPNVSVNVGRITSLRKANGRLEMIQTDAEVNRGNSGGPMLSEAGEVLGVVTIKVVNTGVSFAIPVQQVREFLARPELQLDPIKLAHATRYEPQPFNARVATFAPKPPSYRVQLVLGSGASRREIELKQQDDGQFRAEAPLLVRPEGEARLPVEVSLTDGNVRGRIDDARVKADKIASRLSQLKSIHQQDGKWIVTGRNQQQLALAKPPLKSLAVRLGDVTVDLPWASVKSVTIYPPEPEPSSVAYELFALVDDKPVATLRGEFAITGRPAPEAGPGTENPPPAGDYRPPDVRPQFADEKLVVRLSSPYRDCIVGGSGRYFIAHLKDEKKIVVFDIIPGRVVHEIKDVSDDAILAASREMLIVALPGQKLMQRYSLASLEREKVAPLPGKGITLRALMGANSDGPLLLSAEDAVLVDLETLEPMEVRGELNGGGNEHVHIAYDGRTIARIPTGYGPVAYSRFRIDGRQVTKQNFSGTSNAIRYAWPTADATLIAVTGSQLFGPDLAEVPAKWLDGTTVFPTVDPRYFIAARTVMDEQQKKHVCHVHFCTVGERQIVHTLVGLEELAKEISDARTTLTHQINGGDERMHYIPWAHVLATLPFGNQEIVLRRYDLMHELEQSGVDYLFVDSIPPYEAVRGDALRYAIAVKSKSPDLTYSVATGPDGLTVSDDGVVAWNIPRETSAAAAPVVIAIKSATGKETLHSFTVRLTDAVTVVESEK